MNIQIVYKNNLMDKIMKNIQKNYQMMLNKNKMKKEILLEWKKLIKNLLIKFEQQ